MNVLKWASWETAAMKEIISPLGGLISYFRQQPSIRTCTFRTTTFDHPSNFLHNPLLSVFHRRQRRDSNGEEILSSHRARKWLNLLIHSVMHSFTNPTGPALDTGHPLVYQDNRALVPKQLRSFRVLFRALPLSLFIWSLELWSQHSGPNS